MESGRGPHLATPPLKERDETAFDILMVTSSGAGSDLIKVQLAAEHGRAVDLDPGPEHNEWSTEEWEFPPKGCPMDDQGKRERVTHFLEQQMLQMNSYHDHKETMAHAALLVLMAVVGAVVSTQPWPPSWIPDVSVSRRAVAATCVIAIWFLVYFYMRWQLQKRRAAALWVACFAKILRSWANTPPSEEDLAPFTEEPPRVSKMRQFIDLLVPGSSALVTSDAGMRGYPKVVVDEYRRTDTGAVLGEGIVSCGSILLLLILLLKAWS